MRQVINVIGEIGSVPADEGKNSRPERVHPVQSEEIDPRTGGNTALLDGNALGIDNWQLHPVCSLISTRRGGAVYCDCSSYQFRIVAGCSSIREMLSVLQPHPGRPSTSACHLDKGPDGGI